MLEGGIEGRPETVVFYATSNRRHLMPRDMIENERSSAINPAEAVEEKVSLSDRFGLWLGFHACDQKTYFEIVEGYARHFGLEMEPRAAARRGQRLVDGPRRPLRPGRLAVHPGPRRPPRPAAAVGLVLPIAPAASGAHDIAGRLRHDGRGGSAKRRARDRSGRVRAS